MTHDFRQVRNSATLSFDRRVWRFSEWCCDSRTGSPDVENHLGVSATYDPSPTRGRHAPQRDATRCNAGQGLVGGRLLVESPATEPAGTRGTRGCPRSPSPYRQSPIARTSPRATCKLVPTAKMLSLARDTPAYVSSPTGFTLKLVLAAAPIYAPWERI